MSTVIGRYVFCEMPAHAAHEAHHAWVSNISQRLAIDAAPASCGTLCNAYGDMYLEDRCWNARAVCAIKLEGATSRATLVVGQQRPEVTGTPLHSGHYLTVLGPAAALGVGARSGFGDRLRERLGLPVVNLGRGAAGPNDYLNAWPSISSLLASSRANIVVLMAGRSSGNSAFPAMGGASGTVSMARDAGVKRLLARNDPSWRQLVNESLASALGEYAALAARIRSEAGKGGRTAPPFLLLWFSACDMHRGCNDIMTFPQYFTDPSVVRHIATYAGAQLIDGSHGRVEPAAPLRLDQCRECLPILNKPSRAGTVCLMDDARRETNYNGFAPQDRTEIAAGNRGAGGGTLISRRHAERAATLGCTQHCASVMPTYYPHDAAHEVAAAALVLALQQQADPSAIELPQPEGYSAPPLNVESLSSPTARPIDLPRIDPSRKLFFNHIHKSAGSSFTRFLRSRLPASVWCADLMESNLVRSSSIEALRQWWLAASPNCTLVSLEQPNLGDLLHIAADWLQLAARSSGAAATEGSPQIVSFFRDPVERCLSSWRYEHALCHGRHRMEPIHRDYCNIFLSTYGDGRERHAILAYLRRECSDALVGSLASSGVDAAGILGVSKQDEEKAPYSAIASGAALQNAGHNCWAACSQTQGACPSFCGSGGACCARGFADAPWQCGGTPLQRTSSIGCDGFHCCVLAAPPSTPSPPLHFFGIAEAYDASICLFWYQTGRFQAADWTQSMCTCDQRAALRRELMSLDDPRTKSVRNTHRDRQASFGDDAGVNFSTSDLSVDREEIERMNPGDTSFYRAALREFARRVAIVEDRVGHRFLHCSLDSQKDTRPRQRAGKMWA